MPKSVYYWSHDEEKQLRDLWKSGTHNVDALASKLGRTSQAVEKKIRRLGLFVVGAEKKAGTTTSKELLLPKELPNVKAILEISAAALEALKAPGLAQSEVVRLRSIVQGARVYKDLLADYLDFAGLETRLIELEAKWRVLVEKDRSGHVTPRIVHRGPIAETVRVKDLEAE